MKYSINKSTQPKDFTVCIPSAAAPLFVFAVEKLGYKLDPNVVCDNQGYKFYPYLIFRFTPQDSNVYVIWQEGVNDYDPVAANNIKLIFDKNAITITAETPEENLELEKFWAARNIGPKID